MFAGLSACTGTDATAAQPTAGSPSAIPTTSVPSRDQPVQAPISKAPVSKAESAGCPVTAETLLAVLKDKYQNLPEGHGLRRVECFQDYAIAVRFAASSDSEVATFHYASGSWQYFTGGSGGYCEGVPANVKKHFRGTSYPGCS